MSQAEAIKEGHLVSQIFGSILHTYLNIKYLMKEGADKNFRLRYVVFMVLYLSFLEVKGQREFLCKLPYDSDLLLALKDLAKKLDVKTGVFMLLGALKTASLLYYVQNEKKYVKLTFNFPAEIVSGIGNIAVMNNDLIIHAHVVLADREGKCYGGHLTEGSKVFACEVYLRELAPVIFRKYDPVTGLNLFDI